MERRTPTETNIATAHAPRLLTGHDRVVVAAYSGDVEGPHTSPHTGAGRDTGRVGTRRQVITPQEVCIPLIPTPSSPTCRMMPLQPQCSKPSTPAMYQCMSPS